MTLRAFYALCAVGCTGGWAWIGLSWTFSGQGLWKGCLFKQLFHVPCPSCGSTRAVMALLQGDVTSSLTYNPMGMLLAALLVVLPLGILCDGLRHKPVLYRLFLLVDEGLRRRLVFVAFACAVILNWVWVIVHN